MNLRSIQEHKAELILTIALAASFILGSVLVVVETRTGGMQAQWTFSEGITPSPGKSSFMVLSTEEDGRLLVDEYLQAWDQPSYPRYLEALDENGSLEWRFGHYSNLMFVSQIANGPNGSYYFIDWVDLSFELGFSGRPGSLVVLDHNGHQLWNYTSINGTIDVLGFQADGTVLVEHTSSAFNTTTQTEDGLFTEIIAIRANGSVGWQAPLPIEVGFSDHEMMEDDILAVFWWHSNQTMEIDVDRNGTVTEIGPVEHYRIDYPGSHYGETYYEVRRVYINETSSVIELVAYNKTEQRVEWTAELSRSGNPMNVTGGWDGWSAAVDGRGTIYCPDYHGSNRIFEVAHNGTVMWSKNTRANIVSGFPEGGVLLQEGYTLTKLGAAGDQVWTYDMDQSWFAWSNYGVVLADDGTVYVSGGYSVVALSQAGVSIYVLALIALVCMDVAFVIGYLVYRRRRT